ncbi:MAG TPA: DMT family transporter [Chloroflexia bacterium]|jgi:drug/metabolite transporter (DMT)-like permease|nr:DMT family transporter [Chloroflexia bacterium]
MQGTRIARERDAETRGLAYGFLGVLAFSLTLPATRVAVAYFDPTAVGLGRALVAAGLAALLLLFTRQPWPSRAQWRSLVIVATGVILGFPLLSAWAMSRLPAAHGAVILGLLPLATALAGALRAGERPSRGFWVAGVAGSATVVAFAVSMGAGDIQPADLALFAAVLAAALGYAEGGRLARELGGWQVISWALVLAAPFIAVPVFLALGNSAPAAPWTAWFSFGYVAVVSQFLGFFAWYRGLALGGVARVSQLQLLQPFLTLLASALLLGEQITLLMVGAALLVLVTVALGRKAAIVRPAAPPPAAPAPLAETPPPVR